MIPPIITELARAVLAGDEVAAHALYDCAAERGAEIWGAKPPGEVTVVGLGLPHRCEKAIRRALWDSKLVGVDESWPHVPAWRVVYLSEAELLEQRNFGQISLNEVRKKLAAYGLRLRDS